jgi:hypothetical protein
MLDYCHYTDNYVKKSFMTLVIGELILVLAVAALLLHKVQVKICLHGQQTVSVLAVESDV